MGLKPGIVHASAAGAAETLGGAGLLLGYRTPLASAGIVSVMLTAINRVHLKNGPWAHKGGYEYNVVLAAAAVSLAESGPGGLSLDALRGKEKVRCQVGPVLACCSAPPAPPVRTSWPSRAPRPSRRRPRRRRSCAGIGQRRRPGRRRGHAGRIAVRLPMELTRCRLRGRLAAEAPSSEA